MSTWYFKNDGGEWQFQDGEYAIQLEGYIKKGNLDMKFKASKHHKYTYI